MIKLSRPQAYGGIKPLRGSNGKPLRCTPLPQAPSPAPEREGCANCSECQAKACRTGTCVGPEESDP